MVQTVSGVQFPVLKMNEFRDVPLFGCDHGDPLPKKRFVKFISWDADLNQRPEGLPETGEVTVVQEVDPKQLVVGWQFAKPGVSPFLGIGKSLSHLRHPQEALTAIELNDQNLVLKDPR